MPLGQWYHGSITQTWNTVIDPQTTNIYIWSQGHVHIYEHQGHSKKQYHHLCPHATNSFPLECIPVTSEFQAGNFIISGFTKLTSPPSTTIPNYTTEHRVMHHSTHHSIVHHFPLLLRPYGMVKPSLPLMDWSNMMWLHTPGLFL